MPRILKFEGLDKRECLAFGDIDLNFADQGEYSVSYQYQQNANESIFKIVEMDGGYLHFANSSAGSGPLISIVKTLSNGTIDTRFGVDGVQRIVGLTSAFRAHDVVQLAGGNFVLVTNDSEGNPTPLIGLKPDGTLETAFGEAGYLHRTFDRFQALSQYLPTIDGGLLIIRSLDTELAITKHDEFGQVDTAFGTNGTYLFPRLYNFDAIVTASGMIQVVGLRAATTTGRFLDVYHILPEGRPDEDFGPGGRQSVQSSDFIYPKIDPSDGSIFIYYKHLGIASANTISVSKLSPGLQPDSNFGDNGTVEFQIPVQAEIQNGGLVFDHLGGVIVNLYYWKNPPLLKPGSYFSAKLLSDGSFDSTFGTGGIASYDLPNRGYVRNTRMDSSGNLLWYGIVQPDGNVNSVADALVVKLDATGAIDTSFASAGYLQLELTVDSRTIKQLQLLQRESGRMTVVSGWPPLGAANYYDGKATTLDDAGNVVTDAVFGGYNSQLGIVTSPTIDAGWIVAQLYTVDGNHFIRISKSLSSGQLDANFGTEGRILIPVDRMEDIFLHTAQDGSITIAAGNYNKTADPNSSLGVAIVIRLTPVGTFNSQFGSGGVLRIFEKISTIVDVLHHDALGTAVVFDNYGGPPAGIAISVFDATGQPLSSFGANGTATSVIDGVWRSAEFDEQGRIVAAATNIYDFDPKNRLYKIGPSGSLVDSFGNRGVLELPIEYNYEFDQVEVTLRRGVIAVMGTNSLTAAKLRLAAYDYAGRPLTELAPQGTRDYDLSPFGESVQDLQFADDGSLWLAAQERSEFDSLGKVLRLEGSQASMISNWISFLDVNNDGNIFPSDALLVINHLNSSGSSVTPGTYPDVNADANITPQDALLVINYLNASRGNGEGEAPEKPDVGEPELAQAAQLYAFQFEIPDTSNYATNKGRTRSFARS